MSRTPEIYIMLIAFLITFLFIAFVYLVFFKFKAEVQRRVGNRLLLCRFTLISHLCHWPPLRHPILVERQSGATHDSAYPAPAGANPCHRCAGQAGYSGQEGTAALPVRPSPV